MTYPKLGAIDTLEWGLSLEARGLYTRSVTLLAAPLAVSRVLISGPKPPFFTHDIDMDIIQYSKIQ